MKSEMTHPQLGKIILKTRQNARNFSYRVYRNYIEICGPKNMEHEMIKSLNNRVPNILEFRETLTADTLEYLSPQTHFSCPEFNIQIVDDKSIRQNRIRTLRDIDHKNINISINTNDYFNPKIQNALNTVITDQLAYLAKNALIKQALSIISLHKFPVSQLKISKAKRAWGRCNSKGVVSLSCYLMLAKPELRESVIYHEMAHLYQMNHSKAFYDLLLSWMPDYKDRQKQLKAVKSPLFYTHK